MSKRSLMLANSTFRMAYGVGALLAPSMMAKLRLAADTSEDPQARLFVRGFGSHQVAVAALGLASRRPTLERPAALAALTIDAVDLDARCEPDTLRGMPNVNDPHFDEPREQDGFRVRRARVGHQLGTERLGVSVWELPPGQAAYPYHYHLAEEELVVVLEGKPSLRDSEGWRELEEGEVCSFPRGERGAHQLMNRSASLVRLLALSTHGEPDIVLYPDSGKLGAAERLPRGGGLRKFFRLSDDVDYYDGEQPPGET